MRRPDLVHGVVRVALVPSLTVSPSRIREAVRSPRRRLALALVVLSLGGAVAAHHGMTMDEHGMTMGALCLAVLGGSIGVAVAALADRIRPRPLRIFPPHAADRVPGGRRSGACRTAAAPQLSRTSTLIRSARAQRCALAHAHVCARDSENCDSKETRHDAHSHSRHGRSGRGARRRRHRRLRLIQPQRHAGHVDAIQRPLHARSGDGLTPVHGRHADAGHGVAGARSRRHRRDRRRPDARAIDDDDSAGKEDALDAANRRRRRHAGDALPA